MSEVPVSINFNNARVPTSFHQEGSWELNENIKQFNTARYLVEKDPIGQGRTAQVFRTWDRRLGRLAAAKFALHGEFTGVNFEKEAQVMAKLDHAGIPQIYYHGRAKDITGEERPFMIMEYIDDQNLADREMERNTKPLKMREIGEIIKQTASTLDYMSSQGVNHGDLKPSSIKLSKPHIKIIDFGGSESVSERGTYTAGYTAPEIMANFAIDKPKNFVRSKGDIRSDGFSLAAIAYQLLFEDTPLGSSPVSREDLIKYYNKDWERCNFKEKINKGMLEAVFLKALAINPNDRYQTASEFAQEFSRACNIKPKKGMY